jgi:A/G-specific adenine glycosylase
MTTRKATKKTTASATDATVRGEKATKEGSATVEFSTVAFRNRLRAWYHENARVLPWRGNVDAYATWVSEIMLQQTRVATVIERYQEFLERFPTLQSLAAADESAVLAMWSGLGYYRRARMLHRGAQFVVQELGGTLPSTSIELRSLPGIGEYTAAAIASIAFGESIAVLDGNVERVLLRVLGQPEGMARAKLLAAAQALVPAKARKKAEGEAKTKAAITPGDHNQAMMELGATVCTPRAPLCLQCPVMELCRTRGEHVALPRAQQQSKEVAYLLALRKHGAATEVLLERRANEASLMPGMLELPPLAMEAVTGREPVLRLRHAITNTNYYVQVFSEAATGVSEAEPSGADSDEREVDGDEEDRELMVVAEPPVGDAALSLLGQVVAAPAALEWVVPAMLSSLPLTGLARKVLQRMGVMRMERVRVGATERMVP